MLRREPLLEVGDGCWMDDGPRLRIVPRDGADPKRG